MNKKINLNSNYIFIIIISLVSLLRIFIGNNLGLWFFINSIQDDLLLIDYSNLFNHFMNWNILSLTKDISYSLFLYVVNISNIPYTFYLSILWIVCGLLIVYAIYKFLNKNKLLLVLSFIFIVFLPIAFDSSSGTRVYRNAIMAPMIIIMLSMLFIFILNSLNDTDNKRLLILSILLGLIFTFNFYIKEDGILTLPILLVSIFALIVFHCYKFRSKINFKYLLILIIPILIFGVSTLAYKEVNMHYFGIDEINTRTDGELGEFWQILLKIDDNNKTNKIWVPFSTIEKAWNASPTLQSRPDLLEKWLHSTWANGNMVQNPIPGDHVSWSLRDSLNEAGLFNNEKQADDFFKKVNSELNTAFDNGSLNKSDKIFITSNANGKSINEILNLKPYISSGIKSCIFYKDITIESVPISDSSQVITNNNTKHTEKVLNEKLVTAEDLNKPTFAENLSLKLMKLDIKFYQIISYLVVVLSCISFIYSVFIQFKNNFKNRKINAIIGFEFLLLATFLLEIFAIGWFCSWIDINSGPMKFYTVACQGIFALFEVMSICGAISIYKKNSNKNFTIRDYIFSIGKE